MSTTVKVKRVNVTFWFDESRITEQALKDRFDEVMVEFFGDDIVDDWGVRWVEKLSDSPLFGAANVELVLPTTDGM